MNQTVKEIGKKLVGLIPSKIWLSYRFKKKFGRPIDWKNPTTYNEKLQWLKLYNRRPEYTTMVDKYEVKKYVAERIGEQYIIPTLGVWDKFDDIDFDALPDQFVLKCTHDSGGLIIVRDKSKLDREAARKMFRMALGRNHYSVNREWPYKNVKPRIIAEQYMEDEKTAELRDDKTLSFSEEAISCERLQIEQGLLDYKFMCFDGQVKALFLDIGVVGKGEGHAEQYYRNVYNRDGEPQLIKETREHYPQNVILPQNFSDMVAIAERLSQGVPHLRVDLYRLNNGEIKVGELTFFHGSGLSNIFDPPEWDRIFGDWIELPKKQK